MCIGRAGSGPRRWRPRPQAPQCRPRWRRSAIWTGQTAFDGASRESGAPLWFGRSWGGARPGQRRRRRKTDTRSRSEWAIALNKTGASAEIARLTGSKNLCRSCLGTRQKWSAFYTIAEGFEFLDHAGRTPALGLGAYRGAPFLVADTPMQNHPEQSAKSMGDGPDGLLVSHAREQPLKRHLKYAPFDFDRSLSSLIQKTPHGAVALRRPRAFRLAGALFVARTYSHPRS